MFLKIRTLPWGGKLRFPLFWNIPHKVPSWGIVPHLKKCDLWIGDAGSVPGQETLFLPLQYVLLGIVPHFNKNEFYFRVGTPVPHPFGVVPTKYHDEVLFRILKIPKFALAPSVWGCTYKVPWWGIVLCFKKCELWIGVSGTLAPGRVIGFIEASEVPHTPARARCRFILSSIRVSFIPLNYLPQTLLILFLQIF